jgi:hypothetical protein
MSHAVSAYLKAKKTINLAGNVKAKFAKSLGYIIKKVGNGNLVEQKNVVNEMILHGHPVNMW